MRMYTVGFNKATEVEQYVNNHGISKEQIVSILQADNGTWILMYYDA